MVQLDPDKNIWTPAEIIQCPVQDSRSYSLKTIHGGVYTRNRRFIKPNQTEPATPTPQPTMEQRVTRPTRTIKKPDRLNKTIINSRNTGGQLKPIKPFKPIF